MEKLNLVSGTHVLLESMLQRLQLNTHTNSHSYTDAQASSPSAEINSETWGPSSEAAVYPFGSSPDYSKEQDRRFTVWNNNESPWTQQSSYFGGTSTPVSNLPVRRIWKHGYSAKPKQTPLVWREHNHFTPERSSDVISRTGVDGTTSLEKNPQFFLEGQNKDVLDSRTSPFFKTEPYQTPPDLVVQTFTTAPSVLERSEVRGQSATWSCGVGKDTVNKTKTSKKWGEVKRWAQKVKERWRERHRGRETEQRDDGERWRKVSNEEVHSNLPSLSGLVDVTNTASNLPENPNVHNEPVNTELDGSVSSSPSYMSENLFSFSTSNLMDEIFSGTEWAQFLSVTSTNQNQSNESAGSINQSREETWTGKWNRSDTTDSHFILFQKPTACFTRDTTSNEPVYNQIKTSRNVTELTNQSQTSDLCTSQLQPPDLRLTETQIKEQTQFSQHHSNESKATAFSVPQSQDGKENATPLLRLSYLKAAVSSSSDTHESLRRKREHWTNRRSEDAGQQMDHSSSHVATCSISPSSSSSSLQNSEDSESSVSMETAVKKRRMEDTRHVRFSEEVIILPPSIWPEEDDDDDEEERVEKEAPHPSFPKWIVSFKSTSKKYKI